MTVLAGRSMLTLRLALVGALLLALLPVGPSSAAEADSSVRFESQTVATASNPTSVEFGPDGRLYVTELKGMIKAFTVERNGDSYAVTNTETIDLIQKIPNHNDDGSPHDSMQRNVTGLTTAGTPANPVLYVSSSDPRIDSPDADTNSGVVSRLTWNGSNWEKVDLVRGLPRSAHDHLPNGLALDASNEVLYLAQGGHTNMGAPSNNFENLPEYAYSAAILTIDVTAIDNTTYDLPTLKKTSEPFGGQFGDNQAVLVPGGPVQVHAPGFRNAYDVLLMGDGRLYTSDNGPNNGWGGPPVGQGTAACTNAINENGSASHNDGLHLITGPGYYGGHPNPSRGNMGNTFGGLSPVTSSNPVECNYLQPGQDGALQTYSPSTNGLAEYTASNFGGAMQGDIISTSWNGDVVRTRLNSAGDASLGASDLFTGLSGPLGITAQGDEDPFPGTIWVGMYGNGQITVFEPIDVSDCGQGALDPDDTSSNGFTYGDLIDNDLDPCNPAQVPPDFDGDLVSDLNDPDIDGDGVANADDVFDFDAADGRGTPLPHRLAWNSEVFGGLDGMSAYNAHGFTGHMANTGTSLFDQFDPSALIPGGAAGVFTVEEVTPGDAYQGVNTQQNAFHFGVDVSSTSAPFTVRGRVLAPFAGFTPQNFQSMGISLGAGDQDDYLKVVTTANGGAGGIQFAKEVAGSFSGSNAAAPILEASYVDLYLEVDPATLTATSSYVVAVDGERGPKTTVGSPVTIPASWLDARHGLPVGIISTSTGGSPFAASWQFLEVVEGTDPGDPDPAGTSLSADPTTLDLGPVEVGDSNPGTVTLTNTGAAESADITISGFDLQGASAAAFSLDAATPPIVLGAGESTEVEVTFTPASASDSGVDLVVGHDGDNDPLTIEISAAATETNPEGELSASVGALSFGNVAIDTTTTKSTTLTNTGSQALEITGVDLEGSSAYTVTSDVELTLAAGESTQLDIALSPTAEGPVTATASVAHTGTNESVQVALSGNALAPSESEEVVHRVNAGGPMLTGSPAWDTDTRTAPSPYGNAAEAGNEIYSTVSATSTGPDIDTTHSSVPLGTPDEVFTTERFDPLIPTEPMTWTFPVEVGADHEVRLYFAEIYQRIGTGDRVFDVTIDDTVVESDLDIYAEVGPAAGLVKTYPVDDAASEIVIEFKRGVQNPTIMGIEIVALSDTVAGTLSAEPTSLTFGEVEVDATSTETTTLTNTGGEPLDVTEATISGSPAFSVATELPMTLPAGASAELAVDFVPTAADPATATLALTHDGANGPVEIALAGEGTDPAPDPDPTPDPGAASGCRALSGDWNGSGREGIGWWCDGRAKLQPSGGGLVEFFYGRKGDVPIVADWNGDGQDTISVIRDGTWHINNRLRGGAAARIFVYGRITRGDVPITGAWDYGTRDLPGIVRDREWHLRDAQSGGAADRRFVYGRLTAGDLPLVGDWTGDGRDTVGVVREGRWLLRNRLAGGAADLSYVYGRVANGDVPLMGDWNGDGTDTPAIVRGNTWYLKDEHGGGPADRTIVFTAP